MRVYIEPEVENFISGLDIHIIYKLYCL